MARNGHHDQMRTAGGGSGSSGMKEVKDADRTGGGWAASVLLRPSERSATMKVKVAWPWLP